MSRRLLALASSLALVCTSSLGQETAPEEPDEEQVFELSPFEISTAEDSGYMATTSLAGSRLKTDLRDIAAAVQAITPEFVQDLGATDLEKMLLYTTNTEIGGIDGNYYGGDTWDKGYAREMLVEPQNTARIRGLNDADVTRDYFPSDIPIDWYSLSRVDISRGPNSILFGLGSPAGLINNTLKTAHVGDDFQVVEFRVDKYGSTREVLDVNQPVISKELAVRVVALNDDARFRQDDTFNRDQRVYATARWQPEIIRGVFTQIDVKGEWGKIEGNRPVAGTAADFITPWFGPADRMTIPNDEYWTAPGFVEDLYASQTIGGQLWDDHPVSFYSDPNSAVVGLPGDPQASMLRGGTNVNGGGWGSWVGLINPNWIRLPQHPKNDKAYYADNPTVTAIINDYEAQTGRTFSGFGEGLWPVQMLVDGPVVDMLKTQNLIGPNKSEWNNFEDYSFEVTQSYWKQRISLNYAYHQQNYRSGYTNLMEGLWGMNILSVDVNETLRGSNIPNPNYGRPYTIGEGRGGEFEKTRENWRLTGVVKLDSAEFIDGDSWASRIIGEHTFTGVLASQHYENFDRYYALYRWDDAYINALTDGNNPTGYATWRGIHYLGGSLLNTQSYYDMNDVTGVHTRQNPTSPQTVWYDRQGEWVQEEFSLLSSEGSKDRLYDGASQGEDTTKSKVFVWQGNMLDGVLVPIFGWREDEYTRWNKPSSLARDEDYGFVLPYSSSWNYDDVTPIYVKQQRTSWSLALHGRELMEMLGRPLPYGMDITLLYNDSSSFRPSDTAVSVYNEQEPTPSGETKDFSVLLSAFHNRVSLRVTKYETVQHNTPYFGSQPDFGSNKATLARTMDGMMWEIGDWAGADPTERVQPTPEWLVNKWMFGDNYDKSIEQQPLPADWRDHPELMDQPLRIRQAALPGSSNYVAQGDINPETDLPYVAPPLTAEEVAYREEWFKARSDAEWSRPVDDEFWDAMGFTRDYSATWGGYWEPDAWTRPQNLRSLNDLKSTGIEYELTANPTKNWRITINASKAEAVRSNVLDSWDAYIEENADFWLDGGYEPNDTPASNYWTFQGYYDIPQQPSQTLGTGGRFGTDYINTVYSRYYQAKATEDQLVNELKKWHFNVVTNYSFSEGPLKGIGIGGAMRWEDRPNLGYYPAFNEEANAWVYDLDKPIKGPRQQHYDAWISYEREFERGVTWSIQLNAYNLFPDDAMIPVQANPDGTLAQVRIPGETTWALSTTLRF
ncbi:MAG: TonB-dependent receptor plug [Puniceicoccaceae bacterium 5H]|nr:MAG: TonB-dependent receptor plug [Puniceicoccaceae bacterium 5H]